MSEKSNISNNGEEQVELIIRSAMQTFFDTNVQCLADWTVLELKEHLHNTLLIKPEVSRQRLIYAGYCLDNASTIRNVLKGRANSGAFDTPKVAQVIHLVYSSKEALESAFSSLKNNNSSLRYRPNATHSSTSFNSTGSIQNNIPQDSALNISNLYQFNPATQYMTNPYDYYAYHQNYMNQISSMMQYQQQYLMQQFYQQQFSITSNFYATPHAAQFFGVEQAGVNASTTAAAVANYYPQQFFAGNSAPPSAVAADTRDGLAMHFNQINVAAANPMLFVNNLNAGNNAVVGGEEAVARGENENAPNRFDLFELIYNVVRLVLLGAVLYVYSSFERFFMVLLTISLIWFVQRQRERRIRNDQVLLQQNQQNHAREQQQRLENLLNDLDVDRPQENNGEVDFEVLPNPNIAGQTNNEHLSAWAVFWSTVSSFFTSLIPENPVPVNIN